MSLAYAAKKFGNLDIFLMPATGGRSTQLTHHSADDIPDTFSPDGREVWFSSSRLGSPQTVLAGAYAVSEQLYAVPVIGGRNRLILPTPARAGSLDATGRRLLYEDRPVYENDWRKGAVSDGAHDIWLHDLTKKTHTRLTDFRGDATATPSGRRMAAATTFSASARARSTSGAPPPTARARSRSRSTRALPCAS